MTRLERLRGALMAKKEEGSLVTSPDNLRYLTGFTGSFGTALVTLTDAMFVTDSRYTIQAQEQCKGWVVRWFTSATDGTTFLAEQAKSLGVQRFAIESRHITIARLAELRKRFKPVALKPIAELVEPLRLVKDADEIATIRHAARIVDQGFQHIQRMIREGAVEYDIGLELEFFIKRHSADAGFPPIAVSGERSALPHGRPSEKALVRGEFLTLDFGARYEGYHSDITRTVIVGKASDEQKRVYSAVLEAQTRAIAAMKPGKAGKAIDKVARDTLARYDLARYFGHGLGHSLGLACHDGAVMSPTSKVRLEAGQVWTVEPGVYIEGFGGVRIEDDVLVTNDGVEVLTQSPKHLMEFDR